MLKKGLSVVMPCLNEERTLGTCIEKALKSISDMKIEGEVIVADNGSSDNSIHIAEILGAKVVHVSQKGYGYALRGGIEGASYEYIIMGDADDSYDFSNIEPFIKKLDEGYDLVMENRFKGGIEKGAMSFFASLYRKSFFIRLGQALFPYEYRGLPLRAKSV